MPFTIVILWTDALLWLLVVALVAYGWHCRRQAHLAAPWARVFRSPAGIGSIVVLACYLAVGLADSLHFRLQLDRKNPGAEAAYASDVLSVLDLAATHLRGRSEKTYSAPLATRLYSKEQIETPDGKHLRAYPRLRFGGAHLKDEAGRGADVATTALAALAAAVAALSVLWFASLPVRRRFPDVPWRAGFAALCVIVVIAFPAFALSANYHVLGTDKVGQDVLYLSLKSVRTSIVIGMVTTLIMLPLGVALGITAGYFKGWVDDVIQYVYTTLNSIPGVLLIAASVLMLQVLLDKYADLFPTVAQRGDMRLLALCAILGLTSWTGLARLLRGEALKLGQMEYIQAAHAFGVAHARILSRHILPNVAHIVIIALVMDFSGLVLAEAVLSYVGVGVDPSTTSFGTMINGARLEMAREPMVWWSLAAAFLFMLVLVLAANLLADAVRDGFDPRIRAARPFRLAVQKA